MTLYPLEVSVRPAIGRKSVPFGGLVVLLIATLVVSVAQPGYCQYQTNESLLTEIAHGGPPGSATLLPHPEVPWLSGLTITGLVQNTSGMWVNPHGIRTNTAPFYAGETATNFLATERSFLQVDTNYDLDSHNHFFLRFWGVYEPQYAYNQDRREVDSQSLNENGSRVGCFPPGIPGVVGLTHCTASAAADYYNRLEFREAWWRLKVGPLRLFTGRQIVVWGESLAFRIADVVNPQDLSWNFGFANLEQSRIPLWMVHPTLDLPDLGTFTENFFEAIFVPAWQPCYNNWVFADTPDERYQGVADQCDTVSRLDVYGGRFEGNFQTPFGGPVLAGRDAAYPQASVASLGLPPNVVLPNHFPGSAFFPNAEYGFRVHSLVDQTWEMTALYWHGHQYLPAAQLYRARPGLGPDGKPIDGAILYFPQLNDIGLTMNRPINIPGSIGESLPLVLRSEGVWQDHTPFATRNPGQTSGVKYSGTISTLVALDLDNMWSPWLTTSGNLTVNLEWNNYTILSPSRFMEYAPLTYQLARHNEESFIFATSTSWWWQSISPQWVMVYNPDGNTFLLFPNVVLTPPWTNRYFLKFQYIGILSNNIQDDYAAGMFKGKSLVVMQFQWNFNLL